MPATAVRFSVHRPASRLSAALIWLTDPLAVSEAKWAAAASPDPLTIPVCAEPQPARMRTASTIALFGAASFENRSGRAATARRRASHDAGRARHKPYL